MRMTDDGHEIGGRTVLRRALDANRQAANSKKTLAEIPPVFPALRHVHHLEKLGRRLPANEPGIVLHGFIEEEVQQTPIASIRHTGFEAGAEGHVNHAAICEPG